MLLDTLIQILLAAKERGFTNIRFTLFGLKVSKVHSNQGEDVTSEFFKLKNK